MSLGGWASHASRASDARAQPARRSAHGTQPSTHTAPRRVAARAEVHAAAWHDPYRVTSSTELDMPWCRCTSESRQRLHGSRVAGVHTRRLHERSVDSEAHLRAAELARPWLVVARPMPTFGLTVRARPILRSTGWTAGQNSICPLSTALSKAVLAHAPDFLQSVCASRWSRCRSCRRCSR